MKTHGNSRLSPEFVLLGFLYHSPCHGYELHQRLQAEFGNIWHVSQSQTYNILKRLEAQGYIHSTSIAQGKLPPRQQLHITPSGAERFDTWLAQPTQPSVHAIRVEFITRMYFTRLYQPDSLKNMMEAEAMEVKAGLAQLRQQLSRTSSEQGINNLALELRIELLSSVARWLDRCIETGGGLA